MKTTHFLTSAFLCGAALHAAEMSRAADEPDPSPYEMRCSQDRLANIDLLHARNAWAERCGFIDTERRDYLDAEEYYESLCSTDDNLPGGPTDIETPCEGWSIDIPCPLAK